MAAKLENLDITSVDFVPRGANQRADIMVAKQDKAESVMDKIVKALASVFEPAEKSKPVEVEKEATTFSEAIAEQQICLIMDEFRTANWALMDSFRSILADKEVSNKMALLEQSLDEYTSAMQGYMQKWAGGELVGIAKSKEENKEETEVNIDKSKLSAEELDFLAKIEAKAGAVADTADTQKSELSVEKSEAPVEKSEPQPAKSDILSKFDGIMKALDSTVAKIEDGKLAAVAKKYEILGMKSEELIPFFKELKKDPDMYDSIIKKFDTAVAAVEASGGFDEIGKRGADNCVGDTLTKIAKFADEIQKKNPGTGRVKAEQLAWEQHPELVAEYEAQA